MPLSYGMGYDQWAKAAPGTYSAQPGQYGVATPTPDYSRPTTTAAPAPYKPYTPTISQNTAAQTTTSPSVGGVSQGSAPAPQQTAAPAPAPAQPPAQQPAQQAPPPIQDFTQQGMGGGDLSALMAALGGGGYNPNPMMQPYQPSQPLPTPNAPAAPTPQMTAAPQMAAQKPETAPGAGWLYGQGGAVGPADLGQSRINPIQTLKSLRG